MVAVIVGVPCTRTFTKTSREKTMCTLTVADFISLDGVMQAPGGPEEDRSGEFRFGGWIVPYADEATGEAITDLFSQPFELLLGRRNYDIFAAYWPRIHNHPIADPFNQVSKHVATRQAPVMCAAAMCEQERSKTLSSERQYGATCLTDCLARMKCQPTVGEPK